MNLFKLMATIGIDSSEFNKGIEKAKGSTDNLAGFIKKVGIAAAVGKIGKASIDMGMTGCKMSMKDLDSGFWILL